MVRQRRSEELNAYQQMWYGPGGIPIEQRDDGPILSSVHAKWIIKTNVCKKCGKSPRARDKIGRSVRCGNKEHFICERFCLKKLRNEQKKDAEGQMQCLWSRDCKKFTESQIYWYIHPDQFSRGWSFLNAEQRGFRLQNRNMKKLEKDVTKVGQSDLKSALAAADHAEKLEIFKNIKKRKKLCPAPRSAYSWLLGSYDTFRWYRSFQPFKYAKWKKKVGKKRNKTKSYRCTTCKSEFIKKWMLEYHHRKTHRMPSIGLKECGKSFFGLQCQYANTSWDRVLAHREKKKCPHFKDAEKYKEFVTCPYCHKRQQTKGKKLVHIKICSMRPVTH